MKEQAIETQRWHHWLRSKHFVVPMVVATFACTSCRETSAEPQAKEKDSSGKAFFPIAEQGSIHRALLATTEEYNVSGPHLIVSRVGSEESIQEKPYVRIELVESDKIPARPIFVRRAEDGYFRRYGKEAVNEALVAPFPVVTGNHWKSFDSDGSPIECEAGKIGPFETVYARYPRCLRIISHSATFDRVYEEYYAEGIGRVWGTYDRSKTKQNIEFGNIVRTVAVSVSESELYPRSPSEPSPEDLKEGLSVATGNPQPDFFQITNSFTRERDGEKFFVYEVRAYAPVVSRNFRRMVEFVKRGSKWYAREFAE